MGAMGDERTAPDAVRRLSGDDLFALAAAERACDRALRDVGTYLHELGEVDRARALDSVAFLLDRRAALQLRYARWARLG